MKKLQHPKGFVLTGTDNNGFRHRYSVKKNEQFKKIFIKFMSQLGFDEKKIMECFWTYDESNNRIELKIVDFEDCYRYYENKEYEVDVFYGNKKIIIVVRTNSRRTLLDNLESKSKWIKPIKIKKIKENKKGKKIPLQTIRNKQNGF